MSSKDFIYDLLDKLEDDKKEYVIIVLNNTKREVQGDVYLNISNQASFEAGQVMLENLSLKFREHGLSGFIELDGQDIDITPPEK
jgi:hypothetical protein